jgi:hypothetical protein
MHLRRTLALGASARECTGATWQSQVISKQLLGHKCGNCMPTAFICGCHRLQHHTSCRHRSLFFVMKG